jgi:hypothetical protein
MKLLMLYFLITFVHAKEWVKKDSDFKTIDSIINFDNRASCATKARLPTESVFFMVDNVNMAKAVYRLAKLRGMDPVKTTNTALDKFNQGLSTLVRIISDKLLSGNLPLIEDNSLDYSYLENNWKKSSTSELEKMTQCRIVKKFSSLYSPLNVTKPDKVLIRKIADDLSNIEESFISCDSVNGNNFSEISLFQFDVKFNQINQLDGFRFWYSLKVYLSWAYRFSPEIQEITKPYDFIFRNVDLEEMVLFFSNGCKSISAPECSSHELNLNQLKLLTEEANSFDLSSYEGLKPLAINPATELTSSPLPLKEDDLLNLGDQESASDWVSNFRGNVLKVRGAQKLQLTKAMSQLFFINKVKSPDELEKNISEELNLNPDGYKKDLYYLCSEYKVATDKNLSFLLQDLLLLKEDQSIHEAYQDLYDQSFDESFKSFQSLTSKISYLCQRLDQDGFWDKNLEVKKEGFASWYQQLISQKNNFTLERIVSNHFIPLKPFLKFKGGEVICYSAIHCTRILLDSMMTISSLAKSMSTLSAKNTVLSTNMSNPYSSHMACGAYDPWAKKNKLIYEFFHDLIQGVAFGLLPSPVYVSADLEQKKLVSFSSLIKEGKVFYDPKYDPKKIHLSLIADLGPLTGIPCALSISGSRMNPLEYYSFNGISFSGCHSHSTIELEANNADDVRSSSSTRSYCAACAINLQTISSSVSSLNPVLRFSFFLIKGVTNLFSNLRDPHDLHRNWSLSSHQIALSYRYHGEISDQCAKDLINGKSCLPKRCEGRMLEEFTKKFQASPVESNFSCITGRGVVWIKECKDPIYLSNPRNLKIITDCHLEERTF